MRLRYSKGPADTRNGNKVTKGIELGVAGDNRNLGRLVGQDLNTTKAGDWGTAIWFCTEFYYNTGICLFSHAPTGRDKAVALPIFYASRPRQVPDGHNVRYNQLTAMGDSFTPMHAPHEVFGKQSCGSGYEHEGR